VLGLVVLTTALLWIDFSAGHRILGGAGPALARFYAFAIGAMFAGVIGVGFYPLLGSRVWCRFGCPQAAILGIWQKLFSRFRITTNGDQCMSCGNCSAFCEMGIDVRSYAERGENIVRASCVGCGVCSAVCPRGVLKLENGSTHSDRFYRADRPLDVFLDALRRTGSEPSRDFQN
jgi:polyferredoxin